MNDDQDDVIDACLCFDSDSYILCMTILEYEDEQILSIISKVKERDNQWLHANISKNRVSDKKDVDSYIFTEKNEQKIIEGNKKICEEFSQLTKPTYQKFHILKCDGEKFMDFLVKNNIGTITKIISDKH